MKRNIFYNGFPGFGIDCRRRDMGIEKDGKDSSEYGIGIGSKNNRYR